MTFTRKREDVFNFYAPPEFRKVWKEFLEICSRENSSASQNLRKYIQDYVQKHRQGNPQMLMTTFTQSQLVEKRKCDFPRCNRDAICIGFSKPPGEPKVYLCEVHKRRALENRLLRSYKPLTK